MTEMDLKLYEFAKNLRLQADEYEEMALNNGNGGNLEVKLCSMMYAYREIADKLEQELIVKDTFMNNNV